LGDWETMYLAPRAWPRLGRRDETAGTLTINGAFRKGLAAPDLIDADAMSEALA
jgi:hypothetical protein